MTSPPRENPPDSGAASPALKPSLKIFFASTILLIGTAVAAACFHFPNDFPDAVHDELSSISVPELPNRELEVRELESLPKIPLSVNTVINPIKDTGVEKYAQAYPPPILPIEKPVENVSVAANNLTDEKDIQQKIQQDIHQIHQEISFRPVNTEIKPIHDFSGIPSLVSEPTRKKMAPKPQAVSATEEIDALMPIFRFAENLKPIDKDFEQKMPENPFDAVPKSVPNTFVGNHFIAETGMTTHISNKPTTQPFRFDELPTGKLKPLKLLEPEPSGLGGVAP